MWLVIAVVAALLSIACIVVFLMVGITAGGTGKPMLDVLKGFIREAITGRTR